jgi:6-pyruvoyltetrahydropterin/6-carboxytetrahydropterin synthase
MLTEETLDDVGFVVDYRSLKCFRELIDSELDHRHLNDVIPGPTTAENLAAYLYRRAREFWPEVAAVRVSETEKTWAEYREPSNLLSRYIRERQEALLQSSWSA